MENKDFAIIKSTRLDDNAVNEQVENEVLSRIEEIREKGLSIGSGSTAGVFICEADPQVCYKIITNDKIFRVSTEQEMKLQDSALKSGARVPRPLFCIKGKNIEALVMERIDGHTLEEILEDDAELPDQFELERALDEISQFLKNLHESRIYHRDLAERNIMIDAEGRPWIIDFGKSTRAFSEEEAYDGNVINPISKKRESIHFTDDITNFSTVRNKLRQYLLKKGKDSLVT